MQSLPEWVEHPFTNGSTYLGFKNPTTQLFEGFGIFNSQDGKYEGNWKNGKREGYGTMVFASNPEAIVPFCDDLSNEVHELFRGMER